MHIPMQLFFSTHQAISWLSEDVLPRMKAVVIPRFYMTFTEWQLSHLWGPPLPHGAILFTASVEHTRVFHSLWTRGSPLLVYIILLTVSATYDEQMTWGQTTTSVQLTPKLYYNSQQLSVLNPYFTLWKSVKYGFSTGSCWRWIASQGWHSDSDDLEM